MFNMKNQELAKRAWRRAQGVWRAEAAEVRRLERTVDPKAFFGCVAAVAGCRGKVLTAGVGTSAAAARKIAHSLCCVERPALFLAPGDGVHGGLGAVQKEDVVIAISKGGNTREIVNLLPAIKKKQAFLIGVTEKEESVLGRECDLLMKVRVEREPEPFRTFAVCFLFFRSIKHGRR